MSQTLMLHTGGRAVGEMAQQIPKVYFRPLSKMAGDTHTYTQKNVSQLPS